MNQLTACLVLCAGMLSVEVRGAALPDGPGKDLIERACVGCHKADEITAYRFTKDEYHAIVQRMAERGAQATPTELNVIADYLFEYFPKVEDTSKINVNKATAQEIAAGLGLTETEAEDVVKYRERHGDYHAWGDLLTIYGVDGRKIEAAKDKMSF